MWDEDKYFFNRHDSASDNVSSGTVEAFAGLAAMIITGVGTVITILLNIRF